MSTYRPISLFSIFNRIFEKMMFTRLKNFFQKHDVLYQNQYGFCKNHSAEHAILDLVTQMQINMDQSKYTFGTLTKLSRDFRNFSEIKFNDEISQLNLSTAILRTNDPSKSFSIFCNKLQGVINKHAPLKLVSKREKK